MAVFICETCGATLKKTQIDRHCQGKCRGAWAFTCIECSKTFEGMEYKEHNQCMTEVEKYQGSFLERQRLEKLAAKKKQQLEKAVKKQSASASDNDEETKVESAAAQD